MMKIAITSDWHGNLPDVPECDLLIIAGDVLPNFRPGGGDLYERYLQHSWARRHLAPHLCRQPCKRWLMTAGTHDWAFEHERPVAGLLLDEGATVDGVSVWGLPWSLRFMQWAFMADENLIARKLADVRCDVLISHGPPAGPLGLTAEGVVAGSHALRHAIEVMQPKLVVCGHIHEAAGEEMIGATRVINASLVNHKYQAVHPIRVVEI